jgi:[histone H3]-lysine36 N-dimethyltransferase SETMAR
LARAKLQKLGWEVLPHPAYRPALAPSDYHLFRVLKADLDEQHFDKDVKKWLQNFLDQNSIFSTRELY